LASKLRLMRNHGFSDFDRVQCLGTNAKMSEPSAAMGLTSLESMDRFVSVNQMHFRCYARLLSDLPGLYLVPYNENESCTYQYIVVRINASIAGISRDELLRVLGAERVLARRYFYPGCHRMEPYVSQNLSRRLPNTELLAEQILCLPTGTAICEAEVEKICDLIRFALRNGSEIVRRLRGIQN
jgi:dTDP-4-amino-4,6-dideoxygalactose transaminase